jgi:hypothetical protein
MVFSIARPALLFQSTPLCGPRTSHGGRQTEVERSGAPRLGAVGLAGVLDGCQPILAEQSRNSVSCMPTDWWAVETRV